MALWSSDGRGLPAMLGRHEEHHEEMYEAADIDGVRNRFQEVFYITIP